MALAIDATQAQTNRFVYDDNNQCVQVLGPDAVSGTHPHQMLAYEYDERGLLFHAIAAPGSPVALTNEFDYNPNCKIKRFVSEFYVEKLTAFDGFDRPSSITDPMGNQTVCFYDANDNPKVVRVFGELNDVAGSSGNIRLAESRYEYDSLDRCVRAHDLFFNPATQSPIGSGDAVSSCVYAPNDECVSETDSLGRTTSFAYDTACRLSSVTDARGNQAACVRDPAGNVTSLTSTELPDSGSPQVFSTTYAYDTWNRCVSSSDNVGNTFTCAYDSLGSRRPRNQPERQRHNLRLRPAGQLPGRRRLRRLFRAVGRQASHRRPVLAGGLRHQFALPDFHGCQRQYHQLQLRFAGEPDSRHAARRYASATGLEPAQQPDRADRSQRHHDHEHLRPL